MPRCGLWIAREGHREEREEFKDAEKWTVDGDVDPADVDVDPVDGNGHLISDLDRSSIVNTRIVILV